MKNNDSHRGHDAPPPALAPPDHHGGLNRGTVAAGSGLLTTITGSVHSTTTVTTPIALGSGTYTLVDNETGASVVQTGSGDVRILELGTGAATFTLGNGNDIVTDLAGGAIVTVGTGDSRITLGGTGNVVTVGPTLGGTHDVTIINAGSGSAVVTAGDGTMLINAGGANNTITVGTGNDVINLAGGQAGRDGGPGCQPGTIAATTSVTADTLYLGDGTNQVFLGGSGNTIHDGSGTDRIFGAAAGNDSFVLNAAGGTVTVSGFSLTNGDTLDLTSILGGVSASTVLADLSAYVSLSSVTDAKHSGWIDSVLTVTGAGGTATVTLLNTGTLALADMVSSGALKL